MEVLHRIQRSVIGGKWIFHWFELVPLYNTQEHKVNRLGLQSDHQLVQSRYSLTEETDR